MWSLNLAAHVRKEHPDVDLYKKTDNKGIQEVQRLVEEMKKFKSTAAANALKKVLGKRKRKPKAKVDPRKRIKLEDQEWIPDASRKGKRKRKTTDVAGPKAKKNKKD